MLANEYTSLLVVHGDELSPGGFMTSGGAQGAEKGTLWVVSPLDLYSGPLNFLVMPKSISFGVWSISTTTFAYSESVSVEVYNLRRNILL
jgi:hypothetical protein